MFLHRYVFNRYKLNPPTHPPTYKLEQLIQTAFISSIHPPTYSRQVTCPYCKKAKELLTELKAKYEVVEVDALEGKDGFAMRVELDKWTGRSTVPNIFIGGKPVGGFTDGVEQLHKEGKLVGLLKEAGAL